MFWKKRPKTRFQCETHGLLADQHVISFGSDTEIKHCLFCMRLKFSEIFGTVKKVQADG